MDNEERFHEEVDEQDDAFAAQALSNGWIQQSQLDYSPPRGGSASNLEMPSRPRKAIKTASKSAYYADMMDEDSDGPTTQPDLAAYFAQWDVPWKDIVLMCRAYASYLSAQNKRDHIKK